MSLALTTGSDVALVQPLLLRLTVKEYIQETVVAEDDGRFAIRRRKQCPNRFRYPAWPATPPLSNGRLVRRR